MSYSFSLFLSYLGWTLKQQQADIMDLFKQSGSSSDNFFPVDQELSHEDFLNEILLFVEQTQRNFVIREKNQERWEIQPLPWMSQNISENQNKVRNLGFVQEVRPENESNLNGSLCILGATKFRMQTRINFTEFLLRNNCINPKHILLLTGERPVSESVDGPLNELIDLAKELKLNSWKNLFETDIMKNEYYRHQYLTQNFSEPIIIDTKATFKNNVQIRPTTQSTIEAMKPFLDKHPDDLYFITNQPYINYQSGVIEATLRFTLKLPNLKFQVYGESTDIGNNLLPFYEAIGSFIWIKTPVILADMNIAIPGPFKERFLQLYSNHPLIFQGQFPFSAEL